MPSRSSRGTKTSRLAVASVCVAVGESSSWRMSTVPSQLIRGLARRMRSRASEAATLVYLRDRKSTVSAVRMLKTQLYLHSVLQA